MINEDRLAELSSGELDMISNMFNKRKTGKENQAPENETSRDNADTGEKPLEQWSRGALLAELGGGKEHRKASKPELVKAVRELRQKRERKPLGKNRNGETIYIDGYGARHLDPKNYISSQPAPREGQNWDDADGLYNRGDEGRRFLTAEELAERENRTEANQGIEATDNSQQEAAGLPLVASVESGVIKAGNIREAVEAAKKWFAENVGGAREIEREPGKIIFNENGLKNSFSHKFNQAKLDAIPAILPTLEKGEYLGKLPDKDGNPIENYYFAGKARIGGKEEAVFVRTRKAENRPNMFYVHEVFTEEEINKSREEKGGTRNKPPAFISRDFYKQLIADYLEVKGEQTQGAEAATKARKAEKPEAESREGAARPGESRADRYRNELPLVASVKSGVIKKGDGISAIQAAMNWVRKNILSPVKTKAGMVEITPRSIKNSLFHSMYQDKLDAVQALDKVLQNGECLGELPDKDGKRLVNRYYAARVGFKRENGATEKVVFVRTRKADGQGDRFYVHEVFTEDDIRKSAAQETTTRDTDQARFHGPLDFYKNLIADYLEVKGGEQTDREATKTQEAEKPLEHRTREELLGMIPENERRKVKKFSKPGLAEYIREHGKDWERRAPDGNTNEEPAEFGGKAGASQSGGDRVTSAEKGETPSESVSESAGKPVVESADTLDDGVRDGRPLRNVEERQGEAAGLSDQRSQAGDGDRGGIRRGSGRDNPGADPADGRNDSGGESGVSPARGSGRVDGSNGNRNAGRDSALADGSGANGGARADRVRNAEKEAQAQGEKNNGRGDSERGEHGRADQEDERQIRNARNHRIGPDDVLVPGGQVARAKANIAAIRLAKQLETEGREATDEEKKALSQFTGWGSLAQLVFNNDFETILEWESRGARRQNWVTAEQRAKYEKWKRDFGNALHPDLGGMLAKEEWNAAAKSTLNAHYTDRKVVEAMWKMARRLGFRGGKILEPSAGSGLFFGLMPEEISKRSSLTGVELDSMTGLVLKHLYPDADIQITGFQNAKRVGDNSQDLVISNVPFGDYQVFDKKKPQYSKQSIHNYFFSKSIDAAKPGGLCILVTSHHTLDAANYRLREDWAKKADLVGAVRLPGTAFEKNAGTQVTTDIVIFRKKTGDASGLGQNFRGLESVGTKEGEARVNEYFVAHPEMVLGEHSLAGSMYSGKQEYALLPDRDTPIEAGLERATESLPKDIFGAGARAESANAAPGIAASGDREGALVMRDGVLGVVRDGLVEAPEWAKQKKKREEAESYIGVKNVVKELLAAMNTDTDDARVKKLIAELNRVYDGHVKNFGEINRKEAAFLEDDIEFYTAAAIENVVEAYDIRIVKSGPNKGRQKPFKVRRISKGDIFRKRTVFPFREPEKAANIEDALKISRIYRNGVDLPCIASLLDMSQERAKAELLRGGDVFENPATGLLEPKDIYLSGNVRRKLAEAEAAAGDNPDYRRNVEMLREIQPERIHISQIDARLGSTWIPTEVYEKFLEHLGVAGARISGVRIGGEDGTVRYRIMGGRLASDVNAKWGTGEAEALKLFEDCMNLKRSEIREKDADGKSFINREASTAAREKQRLLQEEFDRWLPEGPAADIAEDAYNERVNHSVLRKFEVPDIKYYPGASHAIELRPNQKQGVSRALQESCLLAHGVGSGKTMLQITTAMEARRLGTARKPLIVVQGATLSQFAATFKKLYPAANILAPTEKQRDKKNRKRLLAQMATGDWDAIIVPHGFFDRLNVKPETETRFLREQIDELRTAMDSTEDRRTRKQYEKEIERIKTKLEKLANNARDEAYWDDLGVDMLIVDEAHAYKRGFFTTKMGNVKGIDKNPSQRSLQLLMKSRIIREKTGGKNVILATGTPISNTLTEMWTMFRYIRPDLLEEYHVKQFDDFAGMFARTTVGLEQLQTGEWGEAERLNRYVNGIELLRLWRTASDVVLTEDLEFVKNMPKLKGGKIQSVVCEMTGELEKHIQSLQDLRRQWDRQSGADKKSSVPLEIMTSARKAALDMRLVDGKARDDAKSKTNTAVRNIYERYRRDQDFLGTQLVFADLFQNKDTGFNLFRDIRDKLVALGVPKDEIAIIHEHDDDNKRLALFERVNSGEVRILLGTTEKLGVGVNVQERLATLHHLDAPLRPMDFEQRNGRIRRPGNQNAEVEILAYGTERTLDAQTFQILEAKQKFINQLMRGEISDRSFDSPLDDIQQTFADLQAAYSGNPLVRERNEVTARATSLSALENAHYSQIAQKKQDLRRAEYRLARLEGQSEEAKERTEFIAKNFPGGEIAGRREIAKSLGEWLAATEKNMLAQVAAKEDFASWNGSREDDYIKRYGVDLGHGVKAELTLKPGALYDAGSGKYEWVVESSYLLKGPHNIEHGANFSGANGLLTRMGNALERAGKSLEENTRAVKDARAEIKALEEELKKPFAQEAELAATRQRLKEIDAQLARETKGGEKDMAGMSPGEFEPDDASRASIMPSQFLPARKTRKIVLRRKAAESVVQALGKNARNAAPVEVVQGFDELPDGLKRKFANNAAALEGAYDQAAGKVWMVADNISDVTRTAEVWAHEQIVHHGLRGMLSEAERKRVLNQLWLSLGGMGNAEIRNIAQGYGLKPLSNLNDRQLVMEEMIASMAEKSQAGRLAPREETLWRRIVNAILNAIKGIAQRVSRRNSRMGYENVDSLLKALGAYVMDGISSNTAFNQNGGFFALEEAQAAIRTKPDPKKTVKAYKLFRVREDRPGELFPLFVSANEPVPMGQWVDAEIGEAAAGGKVKSKLGPLAMRPGWHAGDAPIATHIGGKINPDDKKPGYRPDNQVWAEVEVANDVDWQTEANRRAQRTKNGKMIPRTAHITDQLPVDGMYRYKTNPNMTGTWIISGSMKVNRILSDAEVEAINKEMGFADLPRRTPFDAEKYGFTESDTSALASLNVRQILGMGGKQAVNVAQAPEIEDCFLKDDITLLRRIFALPHWIAKQSRQFADIYERQLRRMDERSAAVAKSLAEVPALFGKNRLGARDMDSLKKMVWKIEGKPLPFEEQGKVPKYIENGQFTNGRKKLAANPRFYEEYKKALRNVEGTEAARAAMLEIRKSLDNDLLLAYNRMAEMREVSDDTITKFRDHINHIANYFPHHRYGKYYVQAINDQGEVVFRQHFDAINIAMARKKAAEIAARESSNYPNAKWRRGENRKLPDEVMGAPIDTEAMEQIIRAAAARIGDREQAAKISDLLCQSISDVLKSRGWASHAIGRKGVAGFEMEDITKVLYDYKSGLNGWLTKMDAARDFSRGLSAIDARKQPRLWEYASQYTKDMLRNSDGIDRLTGNIKAVAFAWYLGANIKTAMVNATQNIIVGVPRLQMDAGGGARLWLKGAMDSIASRVTGGKGGNLAADERKLIDELYEQNVITDAFMTEVRGHMEGVSAAGLFNRFTRILGLPMSAVERFNRTSLALAAFRAAMNGNLKQAARNRYGISGQATYEQARQFATDVVKDAHFVYGKSNMPEFMRASVAGRAASGMYTFRTFSHNMLNMWLWALKTQGREGAKFVAKSLGATMALGGVTALPFYATFMALFQGLAGDDDNWTEEIRKALPDNNLMRDIVCYGVPAMAGVNLGGSLQMETPFTQSAKKAENLEELAYKSLGDIIGIPFDLAKKVSRANEARKDENYWKAIEEAAPTFVKNGMQAWRLYTEGQTTAKGRPINSPGQPGARKLTEGEAIAKLLGFQPVSSTKSYEAYAAEQRREKIRSDKIEETARLFLKTLETGEAKYQREGVKEMMRWNERMKKEGKPLMTFNFKDVKRRVNLRRARNSQKPKQMQKGAAQMAVWGV